MLAQLLELKGQRAIAASRTTLAGEIVELVRENEAAAVCISALPPAAVSHARYLCKRLHAQFPELPLVVGLWASNADPTKSLERLTADRRGQEFVFIVSVEAARQMPTWRDPQRLLELTEVAVVPRDETLGVIKLFIGNFHSLFESAS